MIWLCIVVAALAGFYISRRITESHLRSPNHIESDESEKLMQVRNQTMRLSELNSLKNSLNVSNKETEALLKSKDRLEVILTQLEKKIDSNQMAISETLLTRFSKHLRHLLHEGASSRIQLSENIEYLEGSLALLTVINDYQWGFEINTDKIAPIDMGREVKSITLTPWLFEQMWGDVLDGNINKLVLLHLSTDTFELKAILKYSTKDVECKTELL
jgi:uncharacterized protein YneF (UPF0154 family)